MILTDYKLKCVKKISKKKTEEILQRSKDLDIQYEDIKSGKVIPIKNGKMKNAYPRIFNLDSRRINNANTKRNSK